MSNIGIDTESVLNPLDTLLRGDGKPVLFPDALEAIKILRARGHIISLICRVQANEVIRTVSQIGQIKTVLRDSPVFFCKDREGEGREQLCERFHLTTYIDGSVLRLGELPDSVTKRILFRPHRSELQQYGKLLKKMMRVENWGEILLQLSQK